MDPPITLLALATSSGIVLEGPLMARVRMERTGKAVGGFDGFT